MPVFVNVHRERCPKEVNIGKRDWFGRTNTKHASTNILSVKFSDVLKIKLHEFVAIHVPTSTRLYPLVFYGFNFFALPLERQENRYGWSYSSVAQAGW
jgi:hypothetical protein